MSGIYQQFGEFASMAKYGLPKGLYLKREPTEQPTQTKKSSINNCVTMLQALAMRYSLAEIAKQCDLSLSTIHNLVSNKVHNPRTMTFRKVLKFYCYAFYIAAV